MENTDRPLDHASLLEENLRLQAEIARLTADGESSRHFTSILDSLPQTVSMVDPQGNILYLNESSYRAFGYTMADFSAGLSIFQMLVPEDLPRARAEFGKLTEVSGPQTSEYMAQRKDGSTFPVLITCRPLWEDGRFMGISAILVDISRMKGIERRLVDSQEELRKAQTLLKESINQIPAGIMIALAPDCQMFLANPAADEILGQDPQQNLAISALNQRAITWRSFEPGGKSREIEDFPLFRTIRRGESFLSKEMLIRRADGQESWVLVNGGPIHDENGEILAGVIVLLDVTEAKRTEKELQKAQKLESLGILAGGIAHDFNNILTILMGNLSLLSLDVDNQHPSRGLMDDMNGAIARASALTRQLLTFAKGGAPIKEMSVLEELMRNSAEFIAKDSNARCRYRFPPDLWPAEIDKAQFSQVVQNLVLNAMHAMPDGGAIDIQAENMRLASLHKTGLPSGDYVRISVKDHGAGIRPEVQAKIFDPYFSTKDKGTGLGLTIAYSIMRKHGGLISFESEEGKGSSFFLFLPACPGKVPEQARIAPEAGSGAPGVVLVMDDEPSLRTVLGRFLSRVGMECVLTSEGQEVVRAYRDALRSGRKISCVFLDLTVPGGMGGLEALKLLRGIDPGVRAIVCSGYAQDPVMSAYREHGFFGILRKPFTLEQVSDIIREVASG